MSDGGGVRTFRNPILPGFYPDPSICGAGDDYYLVTSSFSYYPGVPLFHSKDLVNWRQIGHVLNRPSQLNLDGLELSQGIFAPTIRYHQGIFYLITTNVGGGGNFLVTSTDPTGYWSDPHWLEDAPGIDPSLFFDDDGKAYYTGTRPNPAGPAYNGDWEVWLQEFDPKSLRLVGEKRSLWKGALNGAIWPEGPHLYKVNDYYYLMIAEGGTGHHHAVTIARSKEITGPYTGNPANPILTHRHLGREYPIVNVGHGDLAQTPKGEWWLVVLASRPYGGYYRNLGRETFLVPVRWEGGWPVVSPGDGLIKNCYPVPDLPGKSWPLPPEYDDFDHPTLDPRWNFLRTPRRTFWSLTEHPGHLRLFLKPETITQLENPSFVGRRQQHQSFLARTVMEFPPQNENEEAGLVCFFNDKYHYRLTLNKKGACRVIQLVKCDAGVEELLAAEEFEAEKVYLQAIAKGQDYSFYYGGRKGDFKPLVEGVDGRILSPDAAGGFVGAYIGLYASSNGAMSYNHADFDWFEYSEHKEVNEG